VVKAANHLALEQREGALYRKHAKAWMAPIRSALREWTWRRGFLDFIMSGPAFLERAEVIFAAHPVSALKLEGLTPAAVARLAKTPLPGLRTLDLNSQRLTPDLLRALLGSPHLGAVHSLELSWNAFGDDGAAMLASARSITGVRSLAVRHCDLTDRGLETLLSSTTLPSLEVLQVQGNALTSSGVRAAAQSVALPRLVSVGFSKDIDKQAQAHLHGRLAGAARR
jgi:hypothetical protein